MNSEVDWEDVAHHLDALYSASSGLESLFPGRKFTLDGHLVGSIGEVVAAYMFDLRLNTASTQGHDAKSQDGRNVEIKLTQGKSVALRHEPDHLIVLQRAKGSSIKVVYNGPGSNAWNAAGKMQKNGQRSVSLSRLSKLTEDVLQSDSLPQKRMPPV
jgi:uncharacterized protein DUF6998